MGSSQKPCSLMLPSLQELQNELLTSSVQMGLCFLKRLEEGLPEAIPAGGRRNLRLLFFFFSIFKKCLFILETGRDRA